MTSLAEFLLARIAEDEKRAKLLHGRRCPGCGDVVDEVASDDFAHSVSHAGGEWHDLTEFQWDILTAEATSSRVLAECAAKRRIVEYRISEDYADDGMVIALRALASVYANHPDYREEWAL